MDLKISWPLKRLSTLVYPAQKSFLVLFECSVSSNFKVKIKKKIFSAFKRLFLGQYGCEGQKQKVPNIALLSVGVSNAIPSVGLGSCLFWQTPVYVIAKIWEKWIWIVQITQTVTFLVCPYFASCCVLQFFDSTALNMKLVIVKLILKKLLV